MDTSMNESEYWINMPKSEQGIQVTRWSMGELSVLNPYMRQIAFGNPPGDPPLTDADRNMAVNVIVLTTTKAKDYDDLAKTIGKERFLEKVQHIGSEIIRHELRDWLLSLGWEKETVNEYVDEEGRWKPIEQIKPKAKTGGNGRPAPLSKTKASKPATTDQTT